MIPADGGVSSGEEFKPGKDASSDSSDQEDHCSDEEDISVIKVSPEFPSDVIRVGEGKMTLCIGSIVCVRWPLNVVC